MQLKKSEKKKKKANTLKGNRRNELIKIKAEIRKWGRKKKAEKLQHNKQSQKLDLREKKNKKQEQKLDKLLDCLIRKKVGEVIKNK